MSDLRKSRRFRVVQRKALTARRGAVLVTALVCLVVVMAMIGTMLEVAIRARRQLHTERDLRQTELLLQAGSELAAMRLASGEDYEGEIWAPGSDSLPRPAQVTIEVKRVPETPSWHVSVVAEYPADSDQSVRRSQSFFYQAALPPNQE